MTRIRLAYIHEFMDRHGRIRRYFRRPGFKRLPLPGLPGSPEFNAAYEAALVDSPAPKQIGSGRTMPGTVNALIVSYYASTAFLTLAQSSQHNRRIRIEKFRMEHGDKRVALLARHHIEKMVAAKIKTPGEALNFLKSVRGLMRLAVAIGMRGDDPTIGVTRPKMRTTGIHTWSEDEIAIFEATHHVGTRARLAFALLLYTAQRRGDVIRMGRQHLHGGFIHVVQRKTGADLRIPVHPALAEVIEATPSNHLTFLTTQSGAPFADASFGNIFREWCREAGLPEHCSAHGLRKAACRRLAEAGASANVIAAISGHKTLREVERYTRAADQAHMAQAGMNMISGNRKEQTVANPETRFAKSRPKPLK